MRLPLEVGEVPLDSAEGGVAVVEEVAAVVAAFSKLGPMFFPLDPEMGCVINTPSVIDFIFLMRSSRAGFCVLS